jgi:hypothetical protein
MTLLPQKLKNTHLLHFEIHPRYFEFKADFFYFLFDLQDSIAGYMVGSPYTSATPVTAAARRSTQLDIAFRQPLELGNYSDIAFWQPQEHTRLPIPSTIITHCKALTRRHPEHTSEAPRSEYLHRTAPEILHTTLIPRKQQFFDKTAKKDKKHPTMHRTWIKAISSRLRFSPHHATFRLRHDTHQKFTTPTE